MLPANGFRLIHSTCYITLLIFVVNQTIIHPGMYSLLPMYNLNIKKNSFRE